MIKATLYGYPLIYQNDNTYSLPNHTGAVQWNGTTKKFQVSNGSMWYDIDNQINFNVDKALIDIMHWAKEKMDEEKLFEEKVKNNPTIADLLKQREDINEKIKIATILTN